MIFANKIPWPFFSKFPDLMATKSTRCLPDAQCMNNNEQYIHAKKTCTSEWQNLTHNWQNYSKCSTHVPISPWKMFKFGTFYMLGNSISWALRERLLSNTIRHSILPFESKSSTMVRENFAINLSKIESKSFTMVGENFAIN